MEKNNLRKDNVDMYKYVNEMRPMRAYQNTFIRRRQETRQRILFRPKLHLTEMPIWISLEIS